MTISTGNSKGIGWHIHEFCPLFPPFHEENLCVNNWLFGEVWSFLKSTFCMIKRRKKEKQ